MNTLEWIEARKAELLQMQAQSAFDRNFAVCLQIQGALLDYEYMREAFTPKVEVTVEEPEEV